MRLVSVVTSTRSLLATRSLISDSRSSTWVDAGRTSTSRIDQPGRPHHLLDDLRPDARARTPPASPRRRSSARIMRLELIEAQRPVVERRRQPEAVVHQVLLARAVAAIHAADLRDRDVALVDDHERIVRQIVDQRRRRLARLAAGQMARVVLDAFAEAHLVQHLEIEARALLDALASTSLLCVWKNSMRSRSSALIASIARSVVARGVT